jgi:FkbM family methyltransferase
LHRIGIDVVRFPGRTSPLGRRMALLRAHRVDQVIDVGANVGQYGRQLRQLGYAGRIVSFEPLAEPFRQLARTAADDADWSVVQAALGEYDGESAMHVAGNVVSSSLLEMAPLHLSVAPASRYVGEERVTVRRLDSVAPEALLPDRVTFLKLDVQGYEDRVLAGASETLANVVGLQVEMQLAPLYDGAPMLSDTVSRLGDRGFDLMSIEPGFLDVATGRQLAVDGIFFRRNGSTP